MSLLVDTKPLEPTPPRPPRPLPAPARCLVFTVDIEEAHLANPVVAVARLLASEAEAYARVDGDDTRLEISVALPDDLSDTRRAAEAWVRWVVHIAGVRGRVARTRGRPLPGGSPWLT